MDLADQNKDRKTRRKSGSLDLGTMMYGKVPPQARDLEDAVLGAIMLETHAFFIAREILEPECFYMESNQRIFKAMIAMEKRGVQIDLLTVVEELKSTGELDVVGGPYYVSKLTNAVVSSANIERHSRIVYQKFLGRLIINFSGELIGEAYEDEVDVFKIVEKMIKMNDSIVTKYLPTGQPYDRLVMKTLKNILNTDPNKIHGIKTGFKSIDRIIDFFIDGLFYVIAARPSMGKTAFLVQLIENLTKQYYIQRGDTEETKELIIPKPVGVIELETHDEAFIQRQLSNISKIDSRKFKRGDLTEEEQKTLIDASNELLSKGMVCDFNPVSTITEVKMKAKSWKQKYNIGILFIDYLQFMEPEDYRMPRERQVAVMSRGLAGLAKELGIPVVAFAQLSREVYKRADKRPQISDLRESGSIEQDARCIMFLHRPEYYGEMEDPESGASLKGITEVIVAKNNEGETGTAKLRMKKELSRFEELDDDPDAGPFKPLQIVIGSKMNPNEFDEIPGWDPDTPF